MPYSLIPGDTPINVISFDTNLSCDLLTHITENMPRIPTEEQETILSIFNNDNEIYKSSTALKSLLDNNDNLMNRTETAAKSKPRFQVAMLPSLMVWALNQDVLKASDYKKMVNRCVSECVASRSGIDSIVSATLFMAQLISLVPEMPQHARPLFLEKTLHEIYSYATPWKNSVHPELGIHYLSLAHRLSSLQSNSTDSNDRTLLNTWHVKVVTTVSETSHENNRAALGNWLATCDLPLPDRLNALEWCNSEIWALPNVVQLLLDNLPACEHKRFYELPWATGEHNTTINQHLVKTYCPSSYPLIELAAKEEDWKDKTRIAAWVLPENTLEPETFAIPQDYMPAA